jgi:hypothetical protein
MVVITVKGNGITAVSASPTYVDSQYYWRMGTSLMYRNQFLKLSYQHS